MFGHSIIGLLRMTLFLLYVFLNYILCQEEQGVTLMMISEIKKQQKNYSFITSHGGGAYPHIIIGE